MVQKRNKSQQKNDSKKGKQNEPEPGSSGTDTNPKQNKMTPNFKFLGFPNQKFAYKGGRAYSAGTGSSSKSQDDESFKGKAAKANKAPKKGPGPGADEDSEPDMDAEFAELMKMPPFAPFFAPPPPKRPFNEGSDEYCTEIVDQLRQSTNTLIDEMKESRKAAKECTEETNKRLIEAIKEMQSDFRKTLVEELPKMQKK